MARPYRRQRDRGDGLFEALVELSVRSPLAGFVAAIVLAGIAIIVPTILPQQAQAVAIVFRILFLILAATTALFAAGTLVFRRLKRGTDALARTVFSKPRPVTSIPSSSESDSGSVATLLSRGENAFYVPLVQAVAGRCAVQVKVPLADLLIFPDDPTDKKRWLNLTANQHVDFVLCDKTTTAPLLVIELDDKSHGLPDRKRRDAVVDEVLKNAGLPIVHVKSQQTYVVQSLQDLVAAHTALAAAP